MLPDAIAWLGEAHIHKPVVDVEMTAGLVFDAQKRIPILQWQVGGGGGGGKGWD